MSVLLDGQSSQDKLAGTKAGSPRGWISPGRVGPQSLVTLSMVAAPNAVHVSEWDDRGQRRHILVSQSPSGTCRRAVTTPMVTWKKGED